ncbi:TPA: GrpB family protein [Staphylococcus aureus]|nr:GrpB family protein [Staphylococcus aureus]HDH2303339.1 GrpB family protein [Staphylococcus aureus]
MYSNVQPFINSDLTNCFQSQYTEIESLLFNLLDSPVKYTKHIGGTNHFKYSTEPILDILVGVENLHDITSLDEKRLNYVGLYRLHHKYNKKVMMAKFNNFHELKQQVRLHIIQMNTQTFESYLALDRLLSTNDEIALQFNTKKHQILQHSLTIRQYEMQKQQYFEKLCKKYL